MADWPDKDVGEAFAAVAREWCECIDTREGLSAAELLVAAQPIIARLYSTALRLPEVDEADPEPWLEIAVGNVESHLDRLEWSQGHSVSEDREWFGMGQAEWQVLYVSLQSQLNHERHWVVNDPYAPQAPEPDSSNLADHVVDVYRDVRYGLQLWQRDVAGREAAVRHWRMSFEQHWGQHALEALRALHALAFSDAEEHVPEEPGSAEEIGPTE